MSIDMSQFYQVFFDESAEHLANMESLLLSLDIEAPEADQLNAIFRAAHSIKGGSGTFGFNDLTEVTHILENLLDRVRKNEIALTHEMVDACLQAGDVLHGLLEAHQGRGETDDAASLAVCARLEKLVNSEAQPRMSGVGDKVDSRDAADRNKAPSAEGIAPVAEQEAGKIHNYKISFPVARSAFSDNAELEAFLEDLGNLGTLKKRKSTADMVKLTLSTYVSEAELRAVFSPCLKSKHLKLTVLPDSTPSGSELISTGEVDAGYGFFDEPKQAEKSKVAEEDYGFFVEPETLKAGIEDAQGYGFFNEQELPEPPPGQTRQAETSPVSEPVLQRRITDNENTPQRRASDKLGAAVNDNSIRVSVNKVDKMVNLVGELVITQAMLSETVSRLDQTLFEDLFNSLTQLARNTRDLQDSVMSVRMMPINLVFSRFQRVVRDSAVKLNKKVQLRIIGESTELDKGLIEKISDPLTHLVRNSLDHGIETPQVRIDNGKDPQGTIILRASHQGGSIVVEVEDDGAGLNRDRILAKAREKGMPVSDSMSDTEVWQLIYAPGFSTAAVITDVSGRGVGMDVVKKNIESIGGRVDVTSRAGMGSTVTIRLPLTLAILDGMSIAVGEQTYIIPLGFIVESLQPAASDINTLSGSQGQVVHVRGEYIPLLELYKLFNIRTEVTDPTKGIVVLLEAEGKKMALFVDELVGQHQVVIKNLETNYRKVPGISGATIMGDGRVALIMDVAALIKMI